MGYLEASGHRFISNEVVGPTSAQGLTRVDEYREGHVPGIGKHVTCPFSQEKRTIINRTYVGYPPERVIESQPPQWDPAEIITERVMLKRPGADGVNRWTEVELTRPRVTLYPAQP